MIYPPEIHHIERARKLLKEGKLVAMPTETVYGLAGDISQLDALEQIFAVKGRPYSDPLIVHLGKREEPLAWLCDQGFVDNIDPLNSTLADKFWPGPLTLVLPKGPRIPRIITGGLDTVAFRMPQHPVAQQILGDDLLLAAPSANRFQSISPTTAAAVAEELPDGPAMIIDGDHSAIGLESTVVWIVDGEARLLRPGGIPREDLEAVLGRSLTTREDDAGRSPGQLEKHYAPRKPVYIARDEEELLQFLRRNSPYRRGALLLPDPSAANALGPFASWPQFCLSQDGDLTAAAHNLYDLLREFDRSETTFLVALLPSDKKGLGLALSDRLHKAGVN